MRLSTFAATVAISLLLSIFGHLPAFAADKELLDVLLGNGAITQAQYDRLLDKDEPAKQAVEQAVNDTRAVSKIDSGGFRAESADKQYTVKIGTRLHAEASAHDGNLPAGIDATDGTELRRARIETKGNIGAAWNWVAEVDFADNETSVKDFWLGYTTDRGTKLSFGSQKQPFSLSLEMSSNDLPFIERSVDNFLAVPFVDRAIGVRAEHAGSNWFFAAGVFGESVSPTAANDEGWGAAGRFVYAPIIDDGRVLHVGVRAAVRTPSAEDSSVRIRDETTHLSNLNIVDTGTIADVDRVTLSGFEAAYAWSTFSIVGEYAQAVIDRDGAADLDFDGWNVYSTWSITGESRADAYRLSSGEFKRLKPNAAFDPEQGNWGAWELALRFAEVDLNDGPFTGGTESVLTTGLNWYPNTNIRFMLEWSRILSTDSSTELRDVSEGLNIFQFRTQYTF